MSTSSPLMSLVAVSKNPELRKKSSSGGVFTVLAEKIIESGGVVFGAVMDSDFAVTHTYTDNIYGLSAMRGSKYVESRLSDSFLIIKDMLEGGRLVLFSGVGCQTAGLKHYLGKDYPNLISVNILCHGVALPRVWKKFIDKRKENLHDVDFRDKSNGWNKYTMALHYTDHTELLSGEENIYINGYFANLFLKSACYKCQFRNFHCQSDITLGDAWGANKQCDAIYCHDNIGASLIMVNTNQGKQFISQLSDRLEMQNINWHQLLEYNPAICYNPVKNKNSEEFLRRLDKGEDIDELLRFFTRPSLYKRLEIALTPLLKALGIKGFTKKFRKFIPLYQQ